MVTVQILRENGYPLTTLKDDSIVALAEKDVKAAYFPDSETFEDEEAKQLLYALTFSLLLKRKIQATRYGTVTKISQYSIASDEAQIKTEIRSYCCQRLEKYATANNFEYTDILQLYDSLFLL